MRLSTLICLIAVSSAGLAACSSTPREPARVDHRYSTSSTSSAQRASMDCSGGYTVRPSDTLSEIALRCGVAMSELASANGLSAPYTLRVGQSLTMPRPAMHIVQRGENLYRIGLRYGIDHTELGRHNGIRPPYQLEVGQQIRLPHGTRVASAASTTGSTRSAAVAPNAGTSSRTSPPPAAAGAPSFDWPVRGTILSNFGPKPDGGRNDGINIEVRSGTEVRAAAPGQVVYSGNQLAGYGELILVRHSGGFVTAYAHNSRLLVREGDTVERGQVIASAGATGSVDRPQVHFEIRNGVTPVDPNTYLR